MRTAKKYYPPNPRIEQAIKAGSFHAYFKLIGLEEIGWLLQWSRSKLIKRIDGLQSHGVVFKDSMGGVFQTVWCSYPELILRYVSLCGKEGKHI